MPTTAYPHADFVVYRAILIDHPGEPLPPAIDLQVGEKFASPVVGEARDFRRVENGLLSALLIVDPVKWDAAAELVQQGVSLFAGMFRVVGPEA